MPINVRNTAIVALLVKALLVATALQAGWPSGGKARPSEDGVR
ncbi:MAG: hypothetical protein QJR03_03215 [Sphaerobacter sp.]|nr:hypothetical protein [Sphaerobacter sp.]